MLKNKLQQAVLNAWSESSDSGLFHLEVALSGGLDSVVLLHLLVSLRKQMNWHISAVHVNHQLQEAAKWWPEFCQDMCRQWDVSLRIETVTVENAAKLGVEAAARKARYFAFSQTKADVVVLGHHADDQVETAFLALLRGGGLRSLSGMSVWRHLNDKVKIWRPLLELSKKNLQIYANEQDLKYVEDPSNKDEEYVRNWLRHSIIPQILKYDDNVSEKILAGVLQRQRELEVLEEVQKQDWEAIFENKLFNINNWLLLSDLRREQQLLYFCRYHQLGGWTKSKLQHFTTSLSRNPTSRHTMVLGDGSCIYADRGRLYPWGDIQKAQFKQLSDLFEKSSVDLLCFSKDETSTELALLQNFGNTQVSMNDVLIKSVQQLRMILCEMKFKALVKKLKQAKIPFFLVDDWPCWFNTRTHQVLVAQVEDKAILQELPIWGQRLAFLKLYLAVTK